MSTPSGAATQPDPAGILQVGLGFWAAKTLLSAVELGLFSALAGRPLPLAALSAEIGLHGRSARDFLDALVALGFLQRSGGVYSNTPATAWYLDRNKPSYIGGILEMANSRLYPFWGRLSTALRTGEPQNETRSGDASPFVALYADPARLDQFLKSMTAVSRGANRAIAARFPWKDYRTVADLGTAQGDLIVQVALANPHLSGIGFDLPQVRPICEAYFAANGLADRVRFEPGSFFEQPLPRTDVLMMGHILHDWSLEEKKFLIRKAFEALSPGGALLVYDSIIDDDRSRNAFGLLMSLNMLVETPGGFDYTGADCAGWMQEAGFRQTRVEPLTGPDSMVVAIK